MKIIFFGTPDYVLPICEALHKSFNSFRSQDFIAVATQPPKPVGRKKTVERSAVDKWAFKHKLEIIYDLSDLPDFDLGICAAYGKIIPAHVIENAKFGILNIHPSLLPQFRGSSPLQATILTNIQPAVTVIKMDELMDHGPIVSSFKSEFTENETTETLRTRLFEESAQFLADLIPPYVDGKAKPQIQDESKVTLTKIVTKEDGFIPPEVLQNALEDKNIDYDWKLNFLPNYSLPPTGESIERLYRALTPWPGIWTTININQNTKRLKINKLHLEDKKLILDEVQLEGKNPVPWSQFKSAYPNFKFEA